MIFKNWINRTFGSTGALTGSDIPYDGVNSVSEQLDDIEVDKASQAEVNAGTDDTKFVTAKTLADKPSETGSTLLATIPLTADGVDVAHDVAWDSYDELFVEVKGATLTGAGGSSGNVGFVAFADGTPSTYIQFLGTAREAWTPFGGSVDDGELFEFGATLRALGVTKMWRPVYFASDLYDRDHSAEGTGYLLDYNGGNYSNLISVGTWVGWDTGSNTWSGHTFRLQLETGTTFTAGTLTVKGRNY